MGTYKVEVTFEIDQAVLDDLTVQRASTIPTGMLPETAAHIRKIHEEHGLDLVTSALSQENKNKVMDLVNTALTSALGSWVNCPVKMVGDGLQVWDLDDMTSGSAPGVPLPTPPE